MFTGIVQAVGEITSVVPAQVAWGGDGIGLRITVSCGQLDVSDVRIGDSIAINGACMTVVHMSGDSFQADVSRESVLKYLEGKIAKWWTPDDVQFVKEIPLTATGKMQKTALRDQFKDYKLPTA